MVQSGADVAGFARQRPMLDGSRAALTTYTPHPMPKLKALEKPQQVSEEFCEATATLGI